MRIAVLAKNPANWTARLAGWPHRRIAAFCLPAVPHASKIELALPFAAGVERISADPSKGSCQ
jgi:hypothetical protein